MRPVAEYVKRLKDRRSWLRARLSQLEQDLDAPAPSDSQERAIEREGDEVLESLGSAGLDELRAIDAALARVEQGTFGICVECGEEIEEGRLDIVPHAALCSACARERLG
ncbi:MAG: TraR/DksA family transcriptional regulator [Alphaproteobacteria bacterium]|nr:MAG: TraR/DksA family transcriptional regulator [Alphaproteobacteria bacterium]